MSKETVAMMRERLQSPQAFDGIQMPAAKADAVLRASGVEGFESLKQIAAERANIEGAAVVLTREAAQACCDAYDDSDEEEPDTP